MTSWTADLDALPRLSLVTEPTPLALACRLRGDIVNDARLSSDRLWTLLTDAAAGRLS